METIQGFITLLLILIPAGGGARIVYCALAMTADQENSASYKRRIRNLIIFIILAECVSGILALVASYFGGSAVH